MARKHNLKRNRVKQPVGTVTKYVPLKTPRVTETSEGAPGAVPVTQDDGTVKYFLVERFRTVHTQGRALGSTYTRTPRTGKKR